MNNIKPYVLIKNQMLKIERQQRGWTQAKVAEALRISTRTVRRWELGYNQPYPYYRKQLSTLFGKTAQELGLLWHSDENGMVDTGEQALRSVTQRATPEISAQVSLRVNPLLRKP